MIKYNQKSSIQYLDAEDILPLAKEKLKYFLFHLGKCSEMLGNIPW